MTENQIKHLEFIQNIITRMNSNSFQIKGWTITIVSALLALAADNKNDLFVLVAIAPTLIFWFVDTYYLQQERRFRALYKDVRKIKDYDEPKIDSLENRITKFSMDITNYQHDKCNYWKCFFSRTIWPLYFLILLSLLIIYYLFTR